jgi:hypothetical protein
VSSRGSRLARSDPTSFLVGAAVAAVAVAAITALIYPLREISPASSNGVVYLLAVLLVSIIWGRTASWSRSPRRPARASSIA